MIELPEFLILSEQLSATIGGMLGFGFSMAIFSYLIGDNPLYRIALHLFIGASVGYAMLITIYQVLLPRLVEPLMSGQTDVMLFVSVPLIFFIFLTLKLSPRLSPLGNISVALMLGVGTAIAVGGALTGTFLPQIQATWLSVRPGASGSLFNNLVIVIGTVSTLLYFQFWVRYNPRTDKERIWPLRILAGVGQGFLVVTLGATYGGMILSGISLFSERVVFLWNFISRLIG